MLASAYRRRTAAFKILCVFLIVLFIFSFAAEPKAQAVGVTAGMIAAAVAAFLASCGLNLAVTGMNESGVSDNIAKLLDQYVGTVAEGLTVVDWLGSASISRSGGALMLTQPGALKLAQFANWLVGEYGVTPSASVVVTSDIGFTAPDGNYYRVSMDEVTSGSDVIGDLFFAGTGARNLDGFSELPSYSFTFLDGTVFTFSEPEIVDKSSYYLYYIYPFADGVQQGSIASNTRNEIEFLGLSYHYWPSYDRLSCCWVFYSYEDDSSVKIGVNYSPFREYYVSASDYGLTDSTLGITADDTITVPTYEDVSEDSGILLDVGGTAEMTDDALIDKVLSDVVSGELSSTQTLTDTATPPAPDPSGDFSLSVVLADVFPFCIPFDIYDFLATMQATREAPRFEFELAFPAEIGGTQTIVLDLSDFEPVAEILRTMELILFCVGLAFVTRQLIRG